MRGGYSEEQRQLDHYAAGYGIDIVASIQVLGHMEKVVRFPEYAGIKDSASCLLAGEEGTYRLIEKMLKTMSSCLRSRRIIIGMDETHGLGEGNYRRLHGRHEPLEIFLQHLQKVDVLAKKHGLRVALYSDMIFKYSSPRRVYLDPEAVLNEEIVSQIPADASLIYWDYYSSDPKIIERMMREHRRTGNAVYAGPLLSVSSFCVQYEATFRTAGTALASARRNGISMAYGCLWHDDGAECCDWLGLLGMQYYAECAYSGYGACDIYSTDSTGFVGNEAAVSMEELSRRFYACTGLSAKWFLDASMLDAVPCINRENRWPPNPSKYLLWQDPLEGLCDADLQGLSLSEYYKSVEERLAEDLGYAGEKGWFLKVPLQLARVLSRKCYLSEELSRHYVEQDREALEKDLLLMKELWDHVRQLWILHREQWMATCSTFGWSRLDLRYGGLMARLKTAEARLAGYLDGSLQELQELTVPRFRLDRGDQGLGNGIWKVYADVATLSDG